MINVLEKIIYIGIFILILFIVYNYSQRRIGSKSYNLCIEKFTEAKLDVPKKIYVFYDDSVLSKINIETLKLNTPLDWDIIVLTKKNINNYVDKQNLEKYKKFNGKRFSDLVTLDILYNNGGVVLDSFIQIYSGDVLNNYITELYYQEYDCSLIEFSPIIKKNKHKYNSFIKSWIYIAPMNSVFIKNLQIDLYENYLLDFNKFIKKEQIIDDKLSLVPSYNEAFFIHYKVINKLLKNGFLYSTTSKIEKSKKVYGIKKAKGHINNDIANSISNYIFKSDI